MTRTIGDWLDQDVYPSLYNHADKVFPEFAFRRTRHGWQSTTTLKADGSGGTQTGKVYLYETTKHCLKDYRLDKAPSLWTYLAEREGLRENKEIVQYLSELSGVPLPDRPAVTGNKPKKGVHPAVLASAHRFMQGCLQHDHEARGVRDYLQSRGYSEEESRAMQLGYLPSQQALREQLLGEGHSSACVKFFINKLNNRVGESHQLAIPCYGAGQRLEGFTFRSLQQETGDKYLNMAGLKKSVALLDFPAGTKDLTLVEGVFDAKIARARGLDAVVPLNGTYLNEIQVKEMTARGVEKITLCLDNDAAGHKATWNIVRKVLQKCPEVRLFVARLPEGVKDPDELMKTQGAEAFQQVLDEAVNAGQYFAGVFKPRLEQRDLESLKPKERDDIFTFCQDIAATLTHPRDLYDYITSMSDVLPAMAYLSGGVPVRSAAR